MRRLSYLLILFITTNFKWHDAVASPETEHVALEATGSEATSETEGNREDLESKASDAAPDMPSESLDEILKKDTHAEGAIQNILGGLALCYNVLANLLLYPIFSFLLLLLSLGAIILGGFWIKKLKAEKSISRTWILFTCLYFLFYLDLFLVVYQKREVLFLFLELEKDLFLTVTAASIGYIVGKFFSSKFFEEKKLP
ncbi:MAG: hypothetical protein NMK33_05250 [Candidatus Cardinium sp.]|uniref:hypothetical protein n=1 Tax=Cardinium endosymbiont of Dermatophagoides farinae TaxID=2597823 RepID=UPI001183BACF|nr:hypothetical protein [Cardinium endosymbiont of Dermatophagoides farinae]TSJ80822.1 hypothetical protein FPG78_02045 [Cardinium endosymbiont of Dermatophagoides farinae]UWW96825.1 MAG: hypothetical protein NMK33_05250 [Candidatus Cardinium sp.]